MRFDGFSPPRIDPRLTKEGAVKDPTFITSVMALWAKGFDTHRIANVLFEHEHVVAYALRIGRERRRGQEAYPLSVAAVALAMGV